MSERKAYPEAMTDAEWEILELVTPYTQRALQIAMASLGMEHLQTLQFSENYVTILAPIHTGGDVQALRGRLVSGENRPG